MKELTREAAKRSNSSLSSASHIATTVPRSVETAPDIVPRRPSAKPSLFHPSNVQLSSTPLKNAAVHKSTSEDFDSLLLDAENDLPISGHHLSSGSSTSQDHRLVRISPIHNQSEHKMASVDKLEVKSDGKRLSENEAEVIENPHDPERSGMGKSELEILNGRDSLAQGDGQEAGGELGRTGKDSPCSCRSMNSSFIQSQLLPQLECECSFSSGGGGKLVGSQIPRPQSSPSVRRLPSSGADPRSLFAETKARMESAWTNIHDFIESEKTRSADISHSSNLDFVSKDGMKTRLVTVAHTGLGREPDGGAVYGSVDKVPSTVYCSENVTNSFGGATDAVVMETALSAEQSRQAGLNRENGGRSWAEILEQSSESCHRSGPSVTAVPVPDLSCSGDDVVTPELLDTLKAKIKELKRRQEQFELDQLLFNHARPATSATDLLPTTSTRPSVSKPCDIFKSETVPMWDRNGEIATGVQTSTCIESSQSGLERTSAARNLMLQFTKLLPASEHSRLSLISGASISDAGCQTGNSVGNGHTDAAANTYANCCQFLPDSQCPVPVSRIDHQHEINSGILPADAEQVAVKTLAVAINAESVSASNSLPFLPSAYTSAVPEVNVQLKSFNPVVGSAHVKTGSRSMQPSVTMSSNSALTNEVHYSQPVASTVLVNSSKAGVVSTATVATSESLPSDSCETHTVSPLPVTNATPADWSDAVTDAVLAENHVDDAFQPVDPRTVLPAPYSTASPSSLSNDVPSQLIDRQTVQPAANGVSVIHHGTFPSVETCPEIPPVGKTDSQDDVQHLVHVSNACSVVSSSAANTDMIQQSPADDETSQQLRSVCKLFMLQASYCYFVINHVINQFFINKYSEKKNGWWGATPSS